MRSAARTVPFADLMRDDISLSRRASGPVGEQLVDRVRSAPRRGSRRSRSRRPNPVSSTRWALSTWSQNSGSTIIGLPWWNASVTVLLPPWVMTRSTCGQDRRLRQEPLPRLVVVERDLVGERALRDDDPVLGRRQQVDQALHQARRPRTRGSPATGRSAPRRAPGGAPAAPRSRPRPGPTSPARCHVGPSGALARVVGLGRVAVEVEPRRFGDEVGAERAVATARARRARGRTRRSRPTCRRASGGPPRGRPASRAGRPPGSPTRTAATAGSLISAGLHDTIRTHGRPDAPSAGNDDDVVLDDDVRRRARRRSRAAAGRRTSRRR